MELHILKSCFLLSDKMIYDNMALIKYSHDFIPLLVNTTYIIGNGSRFSSRHLIHIRIHLINILSGKSKLFNSIFIFNNNYQYENDSYYQID